MDVSESVFKAGDLAVVKVEHNGSHFVKNVSIPSSNIPALLKQLKSASSNQHIIGQLFPQLTPSLSLTHATERHEKSSSNFSEENAHSGETVDITVPMSILCQCTMKSLETPRPPENAHSLPPVNPFLKIVQSISSWDIKRLPQITFNWSSIYTPEEVSRNEKTGKHCITLVLEWLRRFQQRSLVREELTTRANATSSPTEQTTNEDEMEGVEFTSEPFASSRFNIITRSEEAPIKETGNGISILDPVLNDIPYLKSISVIGSSSNQTQTTRELLHIMLFLAAAYPQRVMPSPFLLLILGGTMASTTSSYTCHSFFLPVVQRSIMFTNMYSDRSAEITKRQFTLIMETIFDWCQLGLLYLFYKYQKLIYTYDPSTNQFRWNVPQNLATHPDQKAFISEFMTFQASYQTRLTNFYEIFCYQNFLGLAEAEEFSKEITDTLSDVTTSPLNKLNTTYIPNRFASKGLIGAPIMFPRFKTNCYWPPNLAANWANCSPDQIGEQIEDYLGPISQNGDPNWKFLLTPHQRAICLQTGNTIGRLETSLQEVAKKHFLSSKAFNLTMNIGHVYYEIYCRLEYAYSNSVKQKIPNKELGNLLNKFFNTSDSEFALGKDPFLENVRSYVTSQINFVTSCVAKTVITAEDVLTNMMTESLAQVSLDDDGGAKISSFQLTSDNYKPPISKQTTSHFSPQEKVALLSSFVQTYKKDAFQETHMQPSDLDLFTEKMLSQPEQTLVLLDHLYPDLTMDKFVNNISEKRLITIIRHMRLAYLISLLGEGELRKNPGGRILCTRFLKLSLESEWEKEMDGVHGIHTLLENTTSYFTQLVPYRYAMLFFQCKMITHFTGLEIKSTKEESKN